jgi:hypothetical protein
MVRMRDRVRAETARMTGESPVEPRATTPSTPAAPVGTEAV